MPLFEFLCHECEHRFEALTSATATAAPACPKCSSGIVEKLFSSFAVGAPAGKGRFAKSSSSGHSHSGGGCGTCGDPRGPGSCSS